MSFRVMLSATESSSWTLAVGASALFSLTRTAKLRTYISPRYSYGRSSTTISIALPSVPIDNEVTARTWTVTGSFGVQYALSDRFGVFGEAGLGYAGSSTDSALVGRDRSKVSTWGTRTGAGVILYF